MTDTQGEACPACFTDHKPEDTCPGVTVQDVANVKSQVAALVRALEAWRNLLIVLDNQPYRNEIIELRGETIILLANLPSEALEIARKAQAHDDMAAENKEFRRLLELAKSWYDAGGEPHWCSDIGLTSNIKEAECRAICVPARAALAEREPE